MTFEIEGKVALISGGASGIGLCCAKELLKSGLKGVTLADINEEFGAKALQDIEEQFGAKRAIFVRTDVTNMNNYEEAFRQTVETYNHIDIVVNNAGILNDEIWEKEIAINVNGVVHGTLLGLEKYIPQYKTGPSGVVVNMASTLGLEVFASLPIYVGTKFAVVAMSKAFGDDAHYNRTNVKVLTLCPDATDTQLLRNLSKGSLGAPYRALLPNIDNLPVQKPESVARALVKIIKGAKSGTTWVAVANKEPYEFVLTPRQQFEPK